MSSYIHRLRAAQRRNNNHQRPTLLRLWRLLPRNNKARLLLIIIIIAASTTCGCFVVDSFVVTTTTTTSFSTIIIPTQQQQRRRRRQQSTPSRLIPLQSPFFDDSSIILRGGHYYHPCRRSPDAAAAAAADARSSSLSTSSSSSSVVSPLFARQMMLPSSNNNHYHPRKTIRRNNNIRSFRCNNIIGSCSTTTTTTTTRTTATTTLLRSSSSSLDLDNDDYYSPNQIRPRTKSITASLQFFVHFVLSKILERRQNRHFDRLQKKLQERTTTSTNTSSTSTSGSSSSSSTRTSTITGKQQHLDDKKSSKSINSLRQLFLQLNEQRKNLVQLADYTIHIVAPSFVALIIGALLVSIIPHYYAQCIQLVATSGSSANNLSHAITGLVASTTLAALFTGFRGSLFWIAGSRANYNIRVKLHRNLLLQEAAFFDVNETGYMLSRLNNDVNKIGQVISYHINVVLRQLAQFVFGSIYLIRISPQLSLYAFCGIGCIAIVSAIYGKYNRDINQRVQDTFADATAVSETSFRMSETIRAFDGVKTESNKYELSQYNALELEECQAWGYGFHKFISDSLQGILQVVMLFLCWQVGSRGPTGGGLPASQLTTFLFYTNFVLESSNEVGDQWAKIQGAVGASSFVFDWIKRVPQVRDPPPPPPPRTEQQQPQPKLPQARHDDDEDDKSTLFVSPAVQKKKEKSIMMVNGGKASPPIIHMSNVTLTYENMAKPALQKVDLNVYEGDRVAIVGRSGSGKSSMLRVMMRFYDPTTGNIRLDGRDLTQLARRDLAQKIAVVEQEPSLFPATLLENVLYGIDMDSVDSETGEKCYSERYQQAAARALDEAGLPIHPKSNELNLHLWTRVGEGGRSLSGGQRQRVAIARALVREPEVLLLDEPSSALDSQSEKAVIQALKRALEHANCMAMVTHRLGVVSALGVNRVIVMDNGKIVESGHPEILLKKPKSLYASLAREQGITAASSSAVPELPQ